ncbi:hypothetical protein [Desulfobacca acetoxidans]|uniref:hypothetical protein n=1 Tax=Desulfobacca acetoxidans TaxID=60893 RepID=UPI00059DCF7F|nr:hypothetical protein [Desulfobacca acetoxidans]HAY22678.1 hypothetical protein [Desulfobacterales bacterium]
MELKCFIEVSFWAFCGFVVLAAVSVRFFRLPLVRVMGFLALLAGLFLVAGICLQIGRPPLSGAFESFSYMALVLSFLALTSLFGKEASPLLAAVSWGTAALLLAILVIMPRQVNPDWFIYEYGWTRSFFFCRLSSMALLIYSSLTALSWPRGSQDTETRRAMVSRSRRFLILGTALFLVGEASGFYWCLVWRGDYWRWSRNFLESTMIFLLASAALHLPPKLAVRPQILRLAYSLPGFLSMTAYLVHVITETTKCN